MRGWRRRKYNTRGWNDTQKKGGGHVSDEKCPHNITGHIEKARPHRERENVGNGKRKRGLKKEMRIEELRTFAPKATRTWERKGAHWRYDHRKIHGRWEVESKRASQI